MGSVPGTVINTYHTLFRFILTIHEVGIIKMKKLRRIGIRELDYPTTGEWLSWDFEHRHVWLQGLGAEDWAS